MNPVYAANTMIANENFLGILHWEIQISHSVFVFPSYSGPGNLSIGTE
jgi:hypothetical protein